MGFPGGTKIFGVTLADIHGTEEKDLILFHKHNRLTVLAEDGKTLWTIE